MSNITRPRVLLVGVTPQAIRDIRAERGESLRAFGLVLKRVLEPAAERGFSKEYIRLLEAGSPKAPIPPAIERAVLILGAMLDGVDPLQARLTPVSVLATDPSIEGAIVTSKARLCALAGCIVRFIPRSPRQKFHDKTCRKEHYRRGLKKK